MMPGMESIVIPDEKYRSFIENAGVGIITFNEEGFHLDVNSAFCGMTGYNKNQIIGQKMPLVYWPKRFIQELTEHFNGIKTKGFLKTQTYFQRKNQDIFPVNIIGSTVFDPNTCSKEYIILIEDITEIKKGERELKLTLDMFIALNNKLERNVKDRTKQIQDLIKQKDDFINQLGHDLKNPLNPIVNLLPVIEEKLTDQTSKEVICILKRNAKYMKDLVLKTIQLAKLDSPNVVFTYEILNLNKTIEQILEDMNITFENHNFEFETKIDPFLTIKADKLRFDELIRNLLDNAIKYSPNGGLVSIVTVKNQPGFVQITISDQGVGMTEEQISHIFEDFYKADPSRHDFKSSGLGMPICKKIVEKHGGKIWVESPGQNRGSKISFTIPLKEDEIIV